MKLYINVETKWHGCRESLVIDTQEEFGLSDSGWDNLSVAEKEELALQKAMEMAGFSYSFDYD